MLLPWSELPESAKEKVRSMPPEVRALYDAARNVVWYEQEYVVRNRSINETVYWTQLTDAIEDIEGVEPEGVGL